MIPPGGGGRGGSLISIEAAEVLFSASEVGVGTEIGDSGEDEALWSILFFGLPVPLQVDKEKD